VPGKSIFFKLPAKYQNFSEFSLEKNIDFLAGPLNPQISQQIEATEYPYRFNEWTELWVLQQCSSLSHSCTIYKWLSTNE